jgi:type VI protein secretion system component Hcp
MQTEQNSAMFMPLDEALRTVELAIGSSGSQLDVVLQVKSQRAGEIAGESERSYSDGKPRHDVLAYYFSSGTPSDAGTGQQKGRRRYSAVCIVRNCDAATAKLMSAFASNDDLTVELATYRSGGDNSKDMKPMFLVSLDKAKVKTYTILSGGAMPGTGAVEIIEILFRSILVESSPQLHTGQTGAVSSFQDHQG